MCRRARAAVRVATVLALLLPAATPAAAYTYREFCDGLDALVLSAQANFDGMRSTTASYYIESTPYFLSLRTLPETQTCVISVDAQPTLICIYYTGILPRAEEVTRKLGFDLKRCLAPRITGPVVPTRETATTVEYVTDEGVTVTIDSDDLFGAEVRLLVRAAAR